MSVNTAKLEYYIGQAGFKVPTKIKKRDGNVVKFDIHRIERAVEACYNDVAAERDTRQGPMINAAVIAENATRALSVRFKNDIPTVEAVQDAVEFALLSAGDFEAAKHYILYRDQHSQSRKKREVPTHVTEAFDRDKKFFSEPAQLLNFYDKYSRYNWDLGRRETWNETVDRAVDHLRWEVEQHMDGRGGLSEDLYSEIHSAILNLEVMSSSSHVSSVSARTKTFRRTLSMTPPKDGQRHFVSDSKLGGMVVTSSSTTRSCVHTVRHSRQRVDERQDLSHCA